MGEINLTRPKELDFKKNIGKKNFSDIRQLQHMLQSVSSCLFNKVAKPAINKKELRRKKRLKNHFIEYFSSLNLSPIPTARVDNPIKSPEVHLKSLVNHQFHQIKKPTKIKKPLANQKKLFNSYPQNSLPFKVFSLLSGPSFSFLPFNTSSTIFSIFPHDEKVSLISLKKMSRKVEKKLLVLNYSDSLIETFAKKSHLKCFKSIQKELEKLLMIRKNSGIFSKRYKSSDNFNVLTEISMNRSFRTNEECQSRTVTSRSVSASCKRLGFFNKRP